MKRYSIKNDYFHEDPDGNILTIDGLIEREEEFKAFLKEIYEIADTTNDVRAIKMLVQEGIKFIDEKIKRY